MRERTRNRKRKSQNSNRIIIPHKVIKIGTVITALILFMVIFALFNLTSQKMLNGISINGISVTGMTIDEAKKYIDGIIQERIHEGIKLQYEDKEFVLELNELNIEYTLDQKLQEAYKIGRSGNIIQDNFTILYMLFGKENFEFGVTFDEELFKRQISYLELQLPDRTIENQYYIEGEELIIVRGLDGVIIDTDKIKSLITTHLSNLQQVSGEKMPVLEKPAKKLSIGLIHDEIYKEAQDAYYTVNPFKIYPHVVGLDFAINEDEINEILSSESYSYSIPLKYTQPSITVDNLDINAFPNLLSQSETQFDISAENKANNIAVAISKINDIIIKPGETFSYNKTLGARTVENGYKEAPIYSNGQVVNGLGGGICQVSTTLYNAVLLANLEVVERQNHMFVPSYIAPGFDATVAYGSIDFQFKNTREYPVKISASTIGGIVRVALYGIYEETEYTVNIETEVLEVTPYKTLRIYDSSLAEGEEELIQLGVDGTKVKTYKVVKLKGEEISREEISIDTYRPMQETILVGRV